MDPTLIAARYGADVGQYRRRALHRPAHARLESLQRQLPGRQGDHRPAPGRQRLPGLAAHRRGLRPDGQRRDDRPRRLRDLLRPAAGQHGLRHDLQRAGRVELETRLRAAAGSDRRRAAIRTRRCRSIRPRSASSRRASTSGTSAFSTSCVEEVILDVAYVGSRSTDLLRQVQINAVPFGATFLPQNQDPTRVPSAVAGVDGAAERLPAAVPRLRRHPDVGLQRLRGLQGAADVGDPPVRSRVHGLRLLGVEQGAGDQQHRLCRRRAESDRGADQARSTTGCWTTTGRTTSRSTPSTRHRA